MITIQNTNPFNTSIPSNILKSKQIVESYKGITCNLYNTGVVIIKLFESLHRWGFVGGIQDVFKVKGSEFEGGI